MKKISVPLTREQNVDDHFGHCEFFGIYTISETNEIIKEEQMSSPQGCGCKSNISATLAAQGVKTMLAGGIGAGAINVLANHGIEVVRGCSGKAQDVVKAYIAGNLLDNGISCQTHEHHHTDGQEHVCNH